MLPIYVGILKKLHPSLLMCFVKINSIALRNTKIKPTQRLSKIRIILLLTIQMPISPKYKHKNKYKNTKKKKLCSYLHIHLDQIKNNKLFHLMFTDFTSSMQYL
jgi:hypothetical protein